MESTPNKSSPAAGGMAGHNKMTTPTAMAPTPKKKKKKPPGISTSISSMTPPIASHHHQGQACVYASSIAILPTISTFRVGGKFKQAATSQWERDD
jgi:hypothetical protein